MSSRAVLYPFPYAPDSSVIFTSLANTDWAVFLDSGYPCSTQGRYDIIAVDPVCTLVTQKHITTIKSHNEVIHSTDEPFEIIRHQLSRYKKIVDHHPMAEQLPFNGGAIGYFSYDLARQFVPLLTLATDAENIPDMVVGIYTSAVIVDHEQQKSYILAENEQQYHALLHKIQVPSSHVQLENFVVTSAINANFSNENYQQAFEKIKYYLKEGDCYQVNLTQRFSAKSQGNAWQVYKVLREINAAPFSAYLNLPNLQILSSSPERFLKLVDKQVETKPIKGTRARKPDATENAEICTALQNSEKDRAENLMIVDLLRNDISKVCQKGSVRVPKLFDIESYSTVHHLVSTVIGNLADDHDALDLLKHCFPGGSITGAPKIRAMQIIEELEPYRRGIYCGAIGYIGFNGNMDTNIAIRTLVQSEGHIRFWAGGGIVNDSVMSEEYQESFDKAAVMFDVLKRFTTT
jgi:para-aminobenzoate synthetase component 1